jgi:hypothetical protein
MPIRIATFHRCLIALLVLCTGPAPLVAAPQLYDVEIIIFSNNTRSDQGEAWREPEAAAGPVQGGFRQNRFTELASSRHRLKPVRYSLQQGGEYTVLYHRAWRQLAYSPSRAVDYPVQAMSDDSRNSVEGTIRLERGRYLHLDMDLLLRENATHPPGYFAEGPGITPAYRLTEKRRIKSSELHYFDHPRFGVLALVTPYSAPAQTVEEDTGEQTGPAADSTPQAVDDAAGQATP